MKVPQPSTTDNLIAAAMVLGAGLIFALDVAVVDGAADGAAYAVIVALAGHFGRKSVFRCSIAMAAMTMIAPLMGAEGDETLPQIFIGRAVGLIVIATVAGVLLYLSDVTARAAATDSRIARYNMALIAIGRRALFANKPLKERFEAVTELTAAALGVDTACVAQVQEGARHPRIFDIWDRRVGLHFITNDAPINDNPKFREAMARDGCIVVEDVFDTPYSDNGHSYFARRGIRSLLHTAALYRRRAIGSLVLTSSVPRKWTEMEVSFAKTVSHVVALIFAVQYAERTLQRLDLVSQGIFVLAEDGRVEYANGAARALAGCSDDAQPPPLPFALPSLSGERDRQAVHFNGRDLDVYRLRLPDSEILVRIDDVTERKAAMVETKKMETRLLQSAKLQAMGELAAGVAHDFNNVLGAIMGYARVLVKNEAAGSEQGMYLVRILAACEKGRGLTDEILAFARSSFVERRVMNVSVLVEKALDAFPVGQPGVPQLKVEVPVAPMWVFGNQAQFTQLVLNLLVNAREACDGGRGRIDVSAGLASPADIQALVAAPESPFERLIGVPSELRACCYLRVVDSGRGIAPEYLDRIFEPLFSTKGRGSGLGLAVVHGVVDSHGGFCHVHSVVGGGTTFTIYLPLYDEPANANLATAADLGARGSERILIVDDDIDLAEVLMVGLERLGYSAVAVDDPHEALDAIRQDPDAFDVLVVDYAMPALRGIDLIDPVRAMNARIKIVVCTGDKSAATEETVLAAGADALLRKPVDPFDVSRRIRVLIEPRAAE